MLMCLLSFELGEAAWYVYRSIDSGTDRDHHMRIYSEQLAFDKCRAPSLNC